MNSPYNQVPPQGQPYYPPGTPQGYGAPLQGYGALPTFRVSLTKVTSMVFMTQQRRTVYTGTLEQLETAARNALIHNLTLGWWGIPFGLIWTPVALVRNSNNMKQIRALAQGRP
jgi:hypothetical protein